MSTPNIYEPVADLCRMLGLDPNFVRHLDVGLKHVTAEVYKRHPEHGGKYVDMETETPAVERLTFEVTTH